MTDPLHQTMELVRLAQAGDVQALNDLFARYYDRVGAMVRNRMGQRLRARLETGDILQPAFVKAFLIFDRFEMRNERSLLLWLTEIAERQVRDAIDREFAKKRHPPGALQPIDGGPDDSAALPREIEAGGRGPATQAGEGEQLAALEQCKADLPAHYLEVIRLREFEKLEWRAIAERMGKNTESACRELHKRAIEWLQQAMKQARGGPESG